jgi:hypothetical protein
VSGVTCPFFPVVGRLSWRAHVTSFRNSVSRSLCWSRPLRGRSHAAVAGLCAAGRTLLWLASARPA